VAKMFPIVENPSMSLNLILSKYEKVEYHIRMKIHMRMKINKPIVLKFLVKGCVNLLCVSSTHILLVLYLLSYSLSKHPTFVKGK